MTIETAFTTFPVLTTQRLILRQVLPTDAEALFEVFSDLEAMKFYGSNTHPSVDYTRTLLERLQTRYQKRQGLNWAIVGADERVVGSCNFHNFGPEFRCVETGYMLNRAYWGQGIMFEAMTVMVDFGFHDLALHRIEAIIDDANTASKKLLLKLGFIHEGHLRERFLQGDQMLDEHYYGLLKREWLTTHPDPDIR